MEVLIHDEMDQGLQSFLWDFWETKKGLDNKRAVFNYLKESGCCSRCILRLMGEKHYRNFMYLGQVVEQIDLLTSLSGKIADLVEPPSKKPNLNPCVCCLGALQNGCSVDLVQEVITTIKQNAHEFDDFLLQLTVPPTIELREHLMVNHLTEKFGDIYTQHVTKNLATVRDVWKYVFGPQIGRAFKAIFTPHSGYSVSVHYTLEGFEEECKKLVELVPHEFPNIKRKKKTINEMYGRAAVLKALESVKWEKMKSVYPVPPSIPSSEIQFEKVVCHRDQLYLAGRYNKYSRKLCQTPWFIDGEKRMEDSVEELILGPVKSNLLNDKIVFSSSGREDVDVRMLGDGRPFVLEMFNPRRVNLTPDQLMFIQKEINSATKDISVRDFQVIGKEELQLLKQGEELKQKTYCALCCTKRVLTEEDMKKLEEIKDLVVQQKTPIRVLHRRNLAVRPKIIHSLSGEIIEDRIFKLTVVTQAGTYVKEFVHSDLGRTVPSLRMLLDTEVDIMALDVEQVEIDWPPKITERQT